jgi:hypothetical protein
MFRSACDVATALLRLGASVSARLPAAILLKVLANFCGNLAISHLVNGFNTHYTPTKFIFQKTFLQLALGLSGTKD